MGISDLFKDRGVGWKEGEKPKGWGENWDYTPEMHNYLERLRRFENDSRTGRDPKTGLWAPHDSLEGGTKTIGYGSKLSADELPEGMLLDDAEIEELFVKDAFNNKFTNRGYDWDKLTDSDKIILTEIQYNTGNSGMTESAIKHLGAQDYHSLEELIGTRGYTDPAGTFHPMVGRNEEILDTYIRPYK